MGRKSNEMKNLEDEIKQLKMLNADLTYIKDTTRKELDKVKQDLEPVKNELERLQTVLHNTERLARVKVATLYHSFGHQMLCAGYMLEDAACFMAHDNKDILRNDQEPVFPGKVINR